MKERRSPGASEFGRGRALAGAARVLSRQPERVQGSTDEYGAEQGRDRCERPLSTWSSPNGNGSRTAKLDNCKRKGVHTHGEREHRLRSTAHVANRDVRTASSRASLPPAASDIVQRRAAATN